MRDMLTIKNNLIQMVMQYFSFPFVRLLAVAE
jgi:hypothetical protein